MRSSEITKENLRVGDVLKTDKGGSEATVLEILNNCFLRSSVDDSEEAGTWLTFEEANRYWSIVLPPEEQAPRKVTMAEVREKMGNVEIIQ